MRQKQKQEKEITVVVGMTGYVNLTFQVPNDWMPTEENVEEILDQFDFAEASDICDSIEWKLRNAQSISIFDEDDDVMWEDGDESSAHVYIRDNKIESIIGGNDEN